MRAVVTTNYTNEARTLARLCPIEIEVRGQGQGEGGL
jgi:hypothetical protein